MINNYFRVGTRVFPFLDTAEESVEEAWGAASLLGVPVIYRPASVAGPWDTCGIVGHRHQDLIQEDIEFFEGDLVETDRLRNEMMELYLCFTRVGRRVPLQSMAA